MSNLFNTRLTELIRQVYPDLEVDILASQVIDAFWPEGSHRRKRSRVPSNRLWSEHDAVLIT